MRKVALLVETLEPELVDHMIYLDRLVKIYCRFLKEWRNIEVTSDGEYINIRFHRINKLGYNLDTERTFPIGDLKKRIDGYKRKVRDEFKIRHDNPRLLRERESNKWKKYIQDAKVRMSE